MMSKRSFRLMLAAAPAAGALLVLGLSPTMAASASSAHEPQMQMRMMMHRMMPDLLPPGVTPENLPDPDSPGARLVVQYCGQCHNLPSPAMHSAQEWPDIVERMYSRMRGMSGMMGVELPAPADRTVLLEYLEANALKALPPRVAAAATAPEAGEFKSFCTQCHALPDPASHTAAEWPAVVAKMKGYMATMQKKVPQAGEEKEILSYLEKNAAKKTP
jgi:cytochrome c5